MNSSSRVLRQPFIEPGGSNLVPSSTVLEKEKVRYQMQFHVERSVCYLSSPNLAPSSPRCSRKHQLLTSTCSSHLQLCSIALDTAASTQEARP